MGINNLKYQIGVFILFLTFELSAQTNEMVMNYNYIDQGFVASIELIASIKKQNLIENEINLVLEKTKDSLYSMYVVNKTSNSIYISTQDLHLFLIQEAKDKKGKWKPIEYWQYPTCGTSYLSKEIQPNGILKTESLAYFGNFKTKIRFKLLNNDRIYYSNSINGSINLTQFSIPNNITENRAYESIDKIGGFQLLHKVLFLEPNGMKEYEEKQKTYLMKTAELRKKNRN